MPTQNLAPIGLLLAASALPLWLVGAGVPNTFDDGAIASASEVNANFADLASKVGSTVSYCAHIPNNGTGGAISPNHTCGADWIQSVNRNSTGRVTVTVKTNVFAGDQFSCVFVPEDDPTTLSHQFFGPHTGRQVNTLIFKHSDLQELDIGFQLTCTGPPA